MALTLTSSAFENGGRIPAKHTCDGNNISPPLSISGIPIAAKSLVLVMDDPDIPAEIKAERGIDVYDHWTLFNIPPDTMELGEGEWFGTQGVNGRGEAKYAGPCPPPQYEPKEHRYFFRLYALDAELKVLEGATKEEVLAAAKGHILESAELMGRYARA